jgi:hypothetical protein
MRKKAINFLADFHRPHRHLCFARNGAGAAMAFLRDRFCGRVRAQGLRLAGLSNFSISVFSVSAFDSLTLPPQSMSHCSRRLHSVFSFSSLPPEVIEETETAVVYLRCSCIVDSSRAKFPS